MAISLVVLEALALSVEGFDNKTDGNIITGGVKRVNINGFVYLDFIVLFIGEGSGMV